MPFSKDPSVYILASQRNGTMYIGVTSDLEGRMQEHRLGLVRGFTERYGVTRLVYYEMHPTMAHAIAREKRLKGWNRAWKIRIIEQMNPLWADLYDPANHVLLDGPSDIARLEGR